MTREYAEKLLRGEHGGIAEWNAMRKDNERRPPNKRTGLPDLSGVELISQDLTDANLSGLTLVNARFEKAKLFRADFSDADLSGADFTEADAWPEDLLGKYDFERQVVKQLRDAAYVAPNFSCATMIGTTLYRAKLPTANFIGATLIDARFEGHSGVKGDFRNARVSIYNPLAQQQRGANLQGADFTGATLVNASFRGTRLTDAMFAHANLSGARFIRSSMERVDLTNATVRGTGFQHTILTGATLLEIEVDSGTDFNGAKVDGCTIFRGTLDSMRDFGGLAPADRRRMKIAPGLAALRATYSGFWQWLHYLALGAFVLPYG